MMFFDHFSSKRQSKKSLLQNLVRQSFDPSIVCIGGV